MALRDSIDRTSMHKLALGGAWFFVVVSQLYLVWAGAMLLSGATDSASLYTAMHGGESVSAIGLSYTGAPGIALILLESAVLLAAVIATVLRVPRWRRFGHIALVSWAALWALNLTWLASLNLGFISYGQSLTMTMLLGFTVYRSMRGWNVPVRVKLRDSEPFDEVDESGAMQKHNSEASPPMDFESLSIDDISHSDAVRDLQREQLIHTSKWQRMRQTTVQLLYHWWTGLVALVMRLWPYIRTATVNFWKVLKTQCAALAKWMRGRSVLSQQPTSTRSA